MLFNIVIDYEVMNAKIIRKIENLINSRMLKSWWKDLIKDKNVNNLYWLSILNPFKADTNKLKIIYEIWD